MENIFLVFRFGLVFFLTLIYGLQRQRSHKPVGFGTFILVAIGACGLSIISYDFGTEKSISLIAAVITGIGFLGAGALIKTSTDKVFGFTTATSIWVFSIFGVLIGLGKYTEGMVLYSLIWGVVFFDSYLEKKGIGSYRRKIVIGSNKIVGKKEISEILSGHCTKFTLLSININKKEKRMSYGYLVEGSRKEISVLIKKFCKKNWCTSLFFE